jgi:dsRNA-specific ribonuclease
MKRLVRKTVCRLSLRRVSKKSEGTPDIPIQPIEIPVEKTRPPWYIKNYNGPFENSFERGSVSITGKDYTDTPTPNMIELWETISKGLDLPHRPTLLFNVFTHRSFGYGKIQHNDKLQFIGYNTLRMIVGDYVARLWPLASINSLEFLSAVYVNHATMFRFGTSWNVSKSIQCFEWDNMSVAKKKQLIVEALYSLIGAVYNDYGLNHTVKFVEKNFLSQSPRTIYDILMKNPWHALDDICFEMEGQRIQKIVHAVPGGFKCSIYLSDISRVIGYSEAKTRQEATNLAALNAMVNYSPLIPTDPMQFINKSK